MLRKPNVKQSSNGHIAAAPTVRPPAAVRELAGLEDLPFNELHEVVIALTATGELEEDVLAQIDAKGEPWDQLRHAAQLRRFYVARLVNLWKRSERRDPDTVRHVLGA